MDVKYRFSSKLGEFTLDREHLGWVIRFNAVEIGREYSSAEQAVSALMTRHEFGKSVSELITKAAAPTTLTGWQRLVNGGPRVNGLMGNDLSPTQHPQGALRKRERSSGV